MGPTAETVQSSIDEYNRIGKREFLKQYAAGRGAKNYYIVFGAEFYDLKAIYGASCRPRRKPALKTSRDSKKELETLGFKCVTFNQDEREYEEGKRRWTEVQVIKRNKNLVSDAKEKYGAACIVCDFDFSKIYGSIGVGFIECHHLSPISQRGPNPPPIKVGDVTVLCANCHRMAHYGRKPEDPLTVDQLKAHISAARNSN